VGTEVIETRIVGDLVIVELSRDALRAGGERLKRTIDQLLDREQRKFALDLRRVRYVDSAGLGAIVQVFTTVARRGGRLELKGAEHLRDLPGPWWPR
jgi:anti-anti-sigma factor